MNPPARIGVAIVLGVFLAVGRSRPATAAEKPALPNFHQVTDSLYRGAQPTADGFRQLRQMGIKTVVNLRPFHSDQELLKDTGLGYEDISFKAWHPEREDILRFLRIATATNRTPVFVHCQQGADRTGTMVACYRLAVCGWTKEQALKEMTQGDFGFHRQWQNLIHFVQDLDVAKLRHDAGLP